MSNPTDLKTRILTAALARASRFGVAGTKRNDVAVDVECSSGSISFHYGEERKFKRAIVEGAIDRGNLSVMGAAIAERHPSASKIPEDMRARALRAWVGR